MQAMMLEVPEMGVPHLQHVVDVAETVL